MVDTSESIAGFDDETGKSVMRAYTLCLPMIHISESIDVKINKDISNLFYEPAMEWIQKDAAAFDVNYRVFLNNNILSLIIVRKEGFYVTGYTIYCANIDLTSNQQISLSEVALKKVLIIQP